MTERDADERLRAAFRGQPDADAGPLPDDVHEQIWRAVSGDLDPDQRRAVVERTASDPAAAEAWRVARALWQARSEGESAGQDVSQPRADRRPVAPIARRTRFLNTPWLAAAAAIVLVTAVASLQYWRSGPAGDEFRVAPEATIQSVLPEDAILPRNAVRLRWTAGPEGARYRVRVTTEDLRVLASAGDLTEPEFSVAPDALAELPADAVVLWQVEMSLPSGQIIASPTFDVRVR